MTYPTTDRLSVPKHTQIQVVARAQHFVFESANYDFNPYQLVASLVSFNNTWRSTGDMDREWNVSFDPIAESVTLDGSAVQITVNDDQLAVEGYAIDDAVSKLLYEDFHTLRERWSHGKVWKASALTVGDVIKQSSDVIELGPAGFSVGNRLLSGISCERTLHLLHGENRVNWYLSFEDPDVEADSGFFSVSVMENGQGNKVLVSTLEHGAWDSDGIPCDAIGNPLGTISKAN